MALEHPILGRIAREGFVALGWFAPEAADQLGTETKFVILIGNAGPDMFLRFARQRNPENQLLDDWTRDVVSAVANDLGATVIFPFDQPPRPFLSWARKAAAGHISTLGLNIHPVFGLWHAYRAALLFPVEFDLPRTSPGAHPCESCIDKPCLSACPVGAFNGQSYDVSGCDTYLRSAEGENCMTNGCKARLACPVGRQYVYAPSQIQFHMRAFKRAREAD